MTRGNNQDFYEKLSEAETTNSARIGSLVTWTRQKQMPIFSPLLWIQDFSQEYGRKSEAKAGLES